MSGFPGPNDIKWIGYEPPEKHFYRGYQGNTNTHRSMVMKNPTFAPGKEYQDFHNCEQSLAPIPEENKRRKLRL